MRILLGLLVAGQLQLLLEVQRLVAVDALVGAGPWRVDLDLTPWRVDLDLTIDRPVALPRRRTDQRAQGTGGGAVGWHVLVLAWERVGKSTVLVYIRSIHGHGH